LNWYIKQTVLVSALAAVVAILRYRGIHWNDWEFMAIFALFGLYGAFFSVPAQRRASQGNSGDTSQ
jgi:hypothetical protein